MTRTLFVGDPTELDLAVYEVVAAAQEAAIAALEGALGAARRGVPLPSGREVDALARGVIEADGRWPAFGHGLGHGIGLATHELPSLGRHAPETPLPSPTVFSIEPGIYVEGETGVRIEDLVVLDAQAGRLEALTRFPSGVVVVGT
jgi:Xaa-Pro aminopeptidase